MSLAALRGLMANVAIIAMLFSFSPGPVLGQIAVPDSSRPGAIRPEQDGRDTLPPSPPELDEIYETPDAVLEVPPVIDRPFEIDEGPKVAVRSFNLVGVENLSRYGINLAELQRILQDSIDAHPQGYTVGQLQEAADQVTTYYRERGLILAQAVVPVQTVDAATVEIRVFVGRLGRVLVEGNTLYSESILSSPFSGLIGRPVTQSEIESALLQLTDYPGLNVFGVFQPGQQVGTADILLSVQNEDRYEFSMRTDNHGLVETGRFRFRPTIDWINPTGAADRLSLSVQQTVDPTNNLFLSADYNRYMGWDLRGGVIWNQNKFDVGGEFADQQITGSTKQYGLYTEKSWVRSRQLNLFTRLAYSHKDSTTDTRGQKTNEDSLSIFTFTTNFDNVDTRFKGIDFAMLEFSQGLNNFLGSMGSSADAELLPIGEQPSRQSGLDRSFASGEFFKVFGNFMRLQTLSSRNGLSLLLRGEVQWSSDLLVPMEQYPVGGPDNVRAYAPAHQLLDRAAFYSIELIKNMPFIADQQAFGNRTWGELVQLSIFYDFAVGRLNSPLARDIQEGLRGYVNFSGVGIQMRFTLPGAIESRFMFATELSNSDPETSRSNQFWGDFTYRF
jgi:hemolysin activation/secretion protein